MGARPSWRAVAIAAAALGSAGVAAALAADGTAPEPVDHRPPAEQFLDAWATSRAATFRLEADFVRTSNSTGAELRDHFVVAQRPPDRLTVDGDGATGLVDGRRIACSYAADGDLRCQEAEAQRTYQDDVDRQVETLSGYVLGDDPLYTVATGDQGCFVVELARELPAPPLGDRATYCFDADRGAPSFTRIERAEAVDETTTVAVQDEVTDADLDPQVVAATG